MEPNGEWRYATVGKNNCLRITQQCVLRTGEDANRKELREVK